MGVLKYTTKTIIDAFKLVHKDSYDYKDVVFNGIHEKVKIWCLKCNESFYVRAANHLHCKTGCKNCFQRGEKNHQWNPNRNLIELRKKVNHIVKSILNYTFIERKEKSSLELLGYTRQQLLDHIAKHPNWADCKDKDWHIDHIFPIAAFVRHNITNPKIINCLDNLQPLSSECNMRKKDKYDELKFLEWIEQFSKEELEFSYEDVLKFNKIGGHKSRRNCSSKYIGVTRPKGKKGWYAKIGYKNKCRNIGYFEDEELAAKHYDFYCLKYYGTQPNFLEFDYSNFIPIVCSGKIWYDR